MIKLTKKQWAELLLLLITFAIGTVVLITSIGVCLQLYFSNARYDQIQIAIEMLSSSSIPFLATAIITVSLYIALRFGVTTKGDSK
jgi:hypothetical protein